MGTNFMKIDNFKFWCQKVLPLVYDDSLSYYEVLCKLTNYVNENFNEVVNALNLLDNEINEIKNDVRGYVKNIIDEMIADGFFDNLIQTEFDEASFLQKGKKFLFYGDSITIGNHKAINENYPYYWSLITHPEYYENQGIGGTCMSPSKNKSIPVDQNTNCMYNRVSNIDLTDIDTIYLMYGTNDYYYSNPVGILDSTDPYDFCGAYNFVMQQLISKAQVSNTRIVLMPPIFYYKNFSRNNAQYNMEDYQTAVVNIAEKYNVSCLDLRKVLGVNDYNIAWKYFDGQTHPTPETYKMIAKIVAKTLYPNELGTLSLTYRLPPLQVNNLIKDSDFYGAWWTPKPIFVNPSFEKSPVIKLTPNSAIKSRRKFKLSPNTTYTFYCTMLAQENSPYMALSFYTTDTLRPIISKSIENVFTSPQEYTFSITTTKDFPKECYIFLLTPPTNANNIALSNLTMVEGVQKLSYTPPAGYTMDSETYTLVELQNGTSTQPNYPIGFRIGANNMVDWQGVIDITNQTAGTVLCNVPPEALPPYQIERALGNLQSTDTPSIVTIVNSKLILYSTGHQTVDLSGLIYKVL